MSGEIAPKRPEGNGLDDFAGRLMETYFTLKGEMIVAVSVDEDGQILTHFEHMADPDGRAGEKTFSSIQEYRDYLIAEGAEDLRPPDDEPKEVEEAITPPHDPLEAATNDEPKETKKPTKIKVEVRQEKTTMPGENPPKFDPLQEANKIDDELHKERYYDMVGNRSEFDDARTYSAAHHDMADYLKTRQYEDEKGNIHDPITARFVKKDNETADEYYERLANETYEETDQYEGKSLMDIARMVADARSRDDKTAVQDIEEVFGNKFLAMVKEKKWSSDAINATIDRYDRVMNGQVSLGKKTEGGNVSSPSQADNSGVASRAGVEGSGQGNPNSNGADTNSSETQADPTDTDHNVITAPDTAPNAPDFKTLAENLRDSDAYKNASPDEQKRMEDELASRLIAAERAKLPQNETDDASKTVDSKALVADLRSSDAYKNASPDEQKRMEDELANRLIAAEQAKLGKNEKDTVGDSLERALEASIPGYKDMTEEERKKIRDELRASGLLRDEEPTKSEKPDEAAEKALKEKIEKIDNELRSTGQFAKYRDALNKYAELKANDDTKGYLPFGIGSKKRERLMAEATTALVEAKKALATEAVRMREAAGIYGGEEDKDKVKQAMSDDLFAEIRKIDPETRDMTNKVLLERQKGRERNIFQRTAVKFGRFLNRGDKAVKRYAKNAGVGVGIGVVKGLALGLSGATWPVGVSVAAAVNAGVLAASRYGAKTDQLDQVLKTHMDDEGIAIPELNDEQFAKLLSTVGDRIPESMQGREGKMTDMLARDILSGSRKAGAEEKKAATARANKNVAAMGIGMALGGAVGGFSARAIHDAWGAAHAPAVTNLAPNPNDMPPHIETPPAVEVPKGPELVGNSFQVESGNGLIREWSQWATANGHPLDGPTSEALHRAVLEKFGPNGIIDLNNVNDAKEIYTQGGDVRLSAPGAAHWRTGVAEYAQQWLQQQGKW